MNRPAWQIAAEKRFQRQLRKCGFKSYKAAMERFSELAEAQSLLAWPPPENKELAGLILLRRLWAKRFKSIHAGEMAWRRAEKRTAKMLARAKELLKPAAFLLLLGCATFSPLPSRSGPGHAISGTGITICRKR